MDDKDEKIENTAPEEEAKEPETTGKNVDAAEEQRSDRKSKKSDTKLKSRVAELEAELKKAQEKLAETEESRLRLAAEYDNFRRRSKDERDAMYADAVGESVRELLPIIDNLKRVPDLKEISEIM